MIFLDKKRVGIGVIAVILLFIIVGFGTLVMFVTDFLWFRELGYTSVFLKKIFTQLQIGIPTFLIITGLTYLYLMKLKKGYYKRVQVIDTDFPKEKTINLIGLGLSGLFAALMTAMTVSQLWFEILKLIHGQSFGLDDPIFKLDIGFYVFRYEFLTSMNQLLIGIIVAFAAVTLIFYFLLISMRRPQITEYRKTSEDDYDDEDRYTGDYDGNPNPNNPFGQVFGKLFGGGGRGPKPRNPQTDLDNLKQLLNIASRQLIVLGIIFFLMVGINFFLRQFGLLYSNTGVLYGAGFTDINVMLWIYRAIMVLSLLAAIMFAIGVKQKNVKKALVVPVIMIVISFAGSGIAMGVQYFIVSPDELSKERPYLENNIKYTRHAHNLQKIKKSPFAASNTLTKEDIVNNIGTISNIRINDFEPAKKFYNQAQAIRTYYKFKDVDVDRYMINGKYTQVFLSARELDSEKTETYTWLNQHLKYTHGYGITLSRVDQVTSSGQPELLIDSIPPISDVEEIEITNPAIYFGEEPRSYVITNTKEKEFDYPKGDTNVYSTYEGDAGIKMGLLNRALFAAREKSLKILVSSNITSDSKIIINREIKSRVHTIAPFLKYDEDPYIVTVDGRLFWIIDGYTTSHLFPYSEPFDNIGTNYIRNSVKVVIDAYNGDTNFYLVDENDPIANTLQKIYPKLFKNFDEMSDSLKAHIRYPNALFRIQAEVYSKYHMTDVEVFYLKEDMWAIAKQGYASGGNEDMTMKPNYYIMKLPGEEKEEFINSIPYTPYSKPNMTGLLVARNDGENYGELILYQLPKSKIIYGPQQIDAQINQDTTISKEFSLWNSAGSNYTRGDMFVIPVEDSMVYVEPIYMEASSNSLPEVKRVIIYYNGRIAYAPTLATALNMMFGEGAGEPLNGMEGNEPDGDVTLGEGQPGIMSLEEMITKANEAFEKATEAQTRGDWAAYGQYLKELEGYLRKMAPSITGGGEEESIDTI